MQVVEIEWFDAVADSCWTNTEYAGTKDVERCKSVGYLFKETDVAYYLTGTQGNENNIMDYTIIPKAMEVTIRVIEPSKETPTTQ